MQKLLLKIRKLGLAVAVLFISLPSFAQLTITDNVTAAQLVDKLVGTGVTTLNPTLTCNNNASAIFSGPSNLGIDSGIVLTTGAARTNGTNIGINSPANQSMQNSAYGFPYGPGDTDLSAMLAGSVTTVTNNACVLQFQFVPAGDTVKFQYVFGSEEYPEYACSQYNDVFGFLISGPGIVSNIPGLPTKRNIALVPGTTNIPVAINSINSGVGGFPVADCASQYAGAPFTQYYVDNLNPVGQNIVFDGFTTVLTAIQNVIPCDTYTLKLAVADVSDGGYNSGVFIKAGSLNSIGLVAGAQGMNVTTSDTAFIVRGCPAAEVTIERQAASPTPLVVPYVMGGNAVNGVDYQYLSGTVTIPADSTIGRLSVKALPLTTTGANKIAIVKFLSPYSCGTNATVIDSAIVSIQDSILLSSSISDTSICFGVQLDVNFVTDDIYGPLSYEWVPNTGVSNAQIDFASLSFPAAGVYEYQYKVRIPSLDTNCRASTAILTINVQDLQVNIGNDTSICSYDQLQMFAEASPQDTGGSYQYSWLPAEIFNDPTSVAPVVMPNSPSTDIVAILRTNIGCIGRDTMRLTVNPGEFVSVTPSDTAICPGEVVIPVLSSTLANTPLLPNYEYYWTPEISLGGGNPTAPNQRFSPASNTLYRLVVKNQFGCYDTSFVDVTVHPNAVVNTPDSIVMWLGESYQLAPTTNAVRFSWFPVSGISDPAIANPVFFPEVNTRYFYTATTDYGCTLRDSIDVLVRQEGVIDMPNAFNPNNSTYKPVFRGNFSLEAFEVYDRWGGLVYTSNNINNGWDGTIKGAAAPLGVYVYTIKLVNNATGSRAQKSGNVTLLR